MGVFNGEKHLNSAIESILNQSLTDFEFIIINDGSTDNSTDIIQKKSDKRIQCIDNQRNIGLSKSLNKAIHLAKGKYIARMDADDISYPYRLAEQVDFLEQHPQISVCGSWVQVIGDIENRVRWPLPTAHDDIKATLLFANALHHPTVVFRQSIFNNSENLYNEKVVFGQDYELWTRLIFKYHFANIPKQLVQYRLYDPTENQIKIHYQLSIAIDIKINYYETLIGRALNKLERLAVAEDWVSLEVVNAWLRLTKTILQKDYLTKKGKLVFASNWLNTAGKVVDAGFNLSIRHLLPYLFLSPNALSRKVKLCWRVLKKL